MKISINDKAVAEKTYVFETVFKNFLRLEYELVVDPFQENYKFEINDRVVIVQDSFFAEFGDDYRKKENVPQQVLFQDHHHFNRRLPFFWGEKRFDIKENETYIGADLIATVFFFLSRWEETVVDGVDKHGRFMASKSAAGRFGIIDLPVVDMITKFFRAVFIEKGLQESEIAKLEFTMTPTHDVDVLHCYRSMRNVLGRFYYHFKEKQPLAIFNEFVLVFNKYILHYKDPYDTYDWLMSLSERYGLKSEFYFMDYGKTKFDKRYKAKDKLLKNIVKNIQQKGHKVGFHPSYLTSENEEEFNKGLKILSSSIDGFGKFGRHHFLRFKTPTTWRIWNNAGMEYDSTLGFAEAPGFRCGTARAFNVFDVESRKQLDLIERPLIVMEQTYIQYLKMRPDDMLKHIKKLMKLVWQYGGDFVILWHNSNFNVYEFKRYAFVYSELLKYYQQLKNEHR